MLKRGREPLVDFFLGLYLVGFLICGATVRRRPAEIALLWPLAILILFIAMAIAVIDLTLEEIEHRRLYGPRER